MLYIIAENALDTLHYFKEYVYGVLKKGLNQIAPNTKK